MRLGKIAAITAVAPIILSLATFFLSYQQAKITRQNREFALAEYRPVYLQTNSIALFKNMGTEQARGVLELKFVNTGKIAGRLLRVRTLIGGSRTKVLNGDDVDSKIFILNPKSFKEHNVDSLFPVGPLDIVEVVAFEPNHFKTLFSGRSLKVVLEADYCGAVQEERRCFVLHSTTLLIWDGERVSTVTGRQFESQLAKKERQDIIAAMIDREDGRRE